MHDTKTNLLTTSNRVADLKTPQERMVQLVRWYMSAFHASRNSDIAKKPYNPILGETFKCYWNAPGYEKSQVAQHLLHSL